MHRSSWRRTSATVLAALAAVGTLVSDPVGSSAAPEDPLSAPVPVPKYIEDELSLLVELNYTATNTATVARTRVVRGPAAPTHLVRADNLVAVTGDGGEVFRTTLPDPALGLVEHEGFVFVPGPAPVVVPYDPRAVAVTLHDLDPPMVVAATDVTAAVADFCAANPTEPSCRRDLRSSITDAPDPAVAGGPLTYRAVMANDGPQPAFRAALRVDVPAGIPVGPLPPGCELQADGAVLCRVERVPAGAQVEFVLPTTVPAGFLNGRGANATVTATAAASSPVGSEADPGDDVASTTTLIEAVSDLSVVKRGDRPVGTANDPVTYTITASNAGPSDADGFQVIDELPDPAEGAFVSAEASDNGVCDAPAGNRMRCSWPSPVPVGASRTVTLHVAVTDDGVDDAITDVASPTSTGRDPALADNRAEVVTAVVKAPTTLTPTPAVAKVLPGLRLSIGELTARLVRADDGRPVSNRPIVFRAGRKTLCTSLTDADGVARCRGETLVSSLDVILRPLLNLGYTASFQGDGRYVASTGTAPLAVVGR